VVRRVAGVLLVVAAVLAVVVFAAGAFNPWRIVALQRYFGNPPAGLVVVAALTLLGSWLLAPLRNEAAQSGRGRVRVVAVVALVLGLLLWGLLGRLFSLQSTVLARNAPADRAVAVFERGSDRHLHVLAGHGLTERDMGNLGIACGEVTARFLGHDEVEVATSYGTWQFRLDPATGRPLDVLGERCSGNR
jgi:hypothetical protein